VLLRIKLKTPAIFSRFHSANEVASESSRIDCSKYTGARAQSFVRLIKPLLDKHRDTREYLDDVCQDRSTAAFSSFQFLGSRNLAPM
jgi:hypothetical protein